MKTNMKTLNLIGLAALMICFVACKKSVPPTVKIYDNAISVSYTSANVTGEVTDEGSSPVTDRGFVYGKQGEAREDTMYCGNGTGEFPTRLTNLETNTTYNCMAFARNDAGTAYSGKATFTTLPMAQSEITTSEPTNIGHTHATCGGYVNSDGGSEVMERGVCWATTANPTTNNSHLNSGTGTGEFSINVTGLTANTTYHVRAYAVNSVGTVYGDNMTFKTQRYTPPTVTTIEVTNIGYTTATCGGNIVNNGGLNITEKGVCWATTQNPTTENSYLVCNGNETGGFTINITGLSPNTRYYLCAYAKNNNGTAYGDNVSFKTLDYNTPIVTTSNATIITNATITCGGNVTADGGASVTARGVCWSKTSQTPTISGSHTTDGTGTGVFTSNITGLTQNTTYYVRAYATNSKGTSYGATKQFITSKPTYLMSEGGTVLTSSGKFYDSGGPNGYYQQGESYVMTFKSNLGADSKIRMTFTRFETTATYGFYSSEDCLEIYDGPTTSSTRIGRYSGFNSPGTVTATNSEGALTFWWYSTRDHINNVGWEATISTVP